MANPGYAISRPGISKLITIIVGIISVGLASYAYDKVWKEEVFLGVIITCLVISVVLYAIYMIVNEIEQKASSKAGDAGFHFIGAILIIAAGCLMIYSAVDLYNHWRYFCAYGFDRGIPCYYDKYGSTNSYYGKSYNGNLNGNYAASGSVNNNNYFNSFPSQSSYGQQQYGIGNNNGYQNSISGDYGYGGGGGVGVQPALGAERTFIKPNWLSWLKGTNVQEECREILPRVLRCNQYFELKLAAGIIAILNGIIYGITGIIILVSN